MQRVTGHDQTFIKDAVGEEASQLLDKYGWVPKLYVEKYKSTFILKLQFRNREGKPLNKIKFAEQIPDADEEDDKEEGAFEWRSENNVTNLHINMFFQ